MKIYNGDCLNEMKNIEDDSVDLIFCDLPYGQTSCKWDCKIDLETFWVEIMRIKKLHTPIFFTTTTKFGVDLIQSAPKKCYFRYDIVWVKSAPAGFLCAKKMPMRKHEMIYVFYEKLPFYDLSSHKHKFIKENLIVNKDADISKEKLDLYGIVGGKKALELGYKNKKYDPPLPTSVVREIKPKNSNKGGLYSQIDRLEDVKYDPPLPTSVIHGAEPEPEPEPEPKYVGEPVMRENTTDGDIISYEIKERKNGESRYEPPLPDTLLEIKSTRGKHSTEKPVALMEWILKYYSKEGDIVLDPTMGSGSTGVACKNMNREFIGIEMDKDIFKVAEERLN